MLRITVSTSGQAAANYFNAELSRGDYYAEKGELVGKWQGQGATLLGLEGKAVEREAFACLASNQHPESGEKLTPRQKSNRRAGYDFTFSAPKSVSVLREYLLETDRHAQAEQLRIAFERAVSDTMQEAEQDMRVRLRAKGQQGDAVTGTMVWAGFTHFQSRPVDGWADPHLHHHAFAMNLTHDGKGWKAGEFGEIKRDAVYYQEAFHARLAAELQEQGYGVQTDARDFELAGIGRETVEKFSRRTAEVEADAQARGVEADSLKSTLGARTRANKDEGLPADETRRVNVSRLSEAERIAFERQAQGEADGSPRQTADQAVDYALRHVFTRQSSCDEKRLASEALKISGGSFRPGELWDALHARRDVLRSRGEGRRTVTTQTAWKEEVDMVQRAQDGRGQAIPLSLHGKHRGIENYAFKRQWLSDEQKAAVRHIIEGSDRVTAIRGGAGTGKTSMLQEAVEAISELSGKPAVVLAPSIQASRGVLREEGFSKADTLAQFLQDRDFAETARGGVIIVDEAGLVGTPDMSALLQTADRLRARVVLQGDTRQHASVERGDALRYLEQSGAVRTAELGTIRRQENATYRAAVGDLAAGKVKQGLARLHKLGAVHEMTDRSERHTALAEGFLSAAAAGESALVVAPTHREGRAVSKAIRDKLRDVGHLGEGRTVSQLVASNFTEAQAERAENYAPGMVVAFHRRAEGGFKPGDRVQVQEVSTQGVRVGVAGQVKTLPLSQAKRFTVYESREIEVAQGDLVRVTGSGKDSAGERIHNGSYYRVAGFDADGGIRLEGDKKAKSRVIGADFGHLAHGYVSTSHSSQGRTVDHVLIAQSSESMPAASREQFYVSVSRGRKSVAIYTDNAAELQDSIQRSGARMGAQAVKDSQAEPPQRWHEMKERVATFIKAMKERAQSASPPRFPEPGFER